MPELGEFTHNVCVFWNSRAGLGQWAGTRDVIAKQLEIEAISTYVHDGMRVLEVGCGNGITAIELARRHDVEILGIDFAEEMIAAARAMRGDQPLAGSVKFQVGDVQDLSRFSPEFDLIYTERVLINLPDWAAQQKAIRSITELLADGGLYVMCENSQDGLEQINGLRERVGLPAIIPPWHNRYFRDAELERLNFPGAKLAGIDDYSSTYYFLSRIVNACLAAEEGRDPEYDAPINRLALRLPSIGNLGQGRIWLWRKVESMKSSQRAADARRIEGRS
jgi:ubiquinone/menaquinone biosynthesis C-methylase UbiE